MPLKLSAALPLLAVLGLSGCQLTVLTSEEPIHNDHADDFTAACEVEHVNEQDRVDCDLANEGVIDVIHPNDALLDDELLAEELAVAETPSEPEVITDVWQRVNIGFVFAVPDNDRLAVQRRWYLRHPEYMERVVKRARPFLYYIVEEIEKRDMPMELALLPIVESAFDPFAYSHGRAAGMWQFIPGTAKRFGMEQTWWYDGRRDVVASTQGALDYLAYLVKYFDGDWLHALAAYNSGEGRVARAIRANKQAGKPIDFWSLRLPKETRAYVPKLLALADILANKEAYEFTWPTVDNKQAIALVDIGSQVDLAFAADLAGMSVKALHALNPGFNRWATDPDGPHRLVLPVDKSEAFSAALAKVDNRERLNWVRHKVKSGDSLIKIAKQYHTTVDVIKQVNELTSNMIRVGDFVMVPVALKALDQYSLSQDQRLAQTQDRQRAAYKINHTVKSGDTLWDLSRKYNVSTRQLASWNGMAPGDMLHPGKTLVVWQENASVSNAQRADAIMKSITYTVRNGDSLSRIADKFNVRVSDITKWNDINTRRYLQPGQKLRLHVDVTRLQNAG